MKIVLLLTACSILACGCVSVEADDRPLPIQPADAGAGNATNDTRSLWLREFGVSVEANCNALLESRRTNTRITVEGVTAGFSEEGSSNTTTVAISVLAERIDTNLVQTVREGVIRAMKREGIGRAEVAFKQGQNKPPVHIIEIHGKTSSLPPTLAPKGSQ